MEAWLITWAGASEGEADDNKVVLILDPSKTPEEVAEIVQLLYAQFSYTLGELARFTEDPSANPYKSEISKTESGYHRIICGHRPWLEARRVRGLSVESSADNLQETVRWEEQTAAGEWDQEQYTATRD